MDNFVGTCNFIDVRCKHLNLLWRGQFEHMSAKISQIFSILPFCKLFKLFIHVSPERCLRSLKFFVRLRFLGSSIYISGCNIFGGLPPHGVAATGAWRLGLVFASWAECAAICIVDSLVPQWLNLVRVSLPHANGAMCRRAHLSFACCGDWYIHHVFLQRDDAERPCV